MAGCAGTAGRTNGWGLPPDGIAPGGLPTGGVPPAAGRAAAGTCGCSTTDGTGTLSCYFFGQSFLARTLRPGVRLVVSGEMANDVMTLKVESASTDVALSTRVGEAIRDITKLRSAVELHAPGTLPNDGKVIDDVRSYK